MGLTATLARILGAPVRRAADLRSRANRVSPVLGDYWDRELGVGQDWMPPSYGEYYPRSSVVYSALKVRQEAVASVPLRISRVDRGGRRRPVEPSHPAQSLLDFPNPFWTRGDLWRATETYLGLWGAAFWGLERDDDGRVVEIWPLRSDRMRVVPDPGSYVKGFVYVGPGRRLVSYVPEDVVWMRYFNPLDEYAGLSPMAPTRLSADVGMEALRASHSSLVNDSSPGLLIETGDTPTDDEVSEFYARWESRFKGTAKVRRPALLSAGMKATGLGFSPREMEYMQSLRWSLEDVGRAFGVPKPMLGDVERVTYSNFAVARRIFWEDTIVPQLGFYAEAINQGLVPQLGDPTLRAAFDLGAVESLRENENDRAKRWQTYVSAGIMTVDEVRREMGLGPMPHAGDDAPARDAGKEPRP